MNMMVNSSASGLIVLPNDLIRSIMALVASSSLTDLSNFKQTCKMLNDLGGDNHIFRCVSMEKIPVIPWFPTAHITSFIQHCVRSGNPEALYRLGMGEYFSNIRVGLGIGLLAKASCLGHEEAMYVLGIILLCNDNDQSRIQGIELLNRAERSKKSKGIGVSECRQKCKQILWRIWLNHLPQQPHPICTNPACDKNSRSQVQGWMPKDEVDYVFDCEACKWDYEVSLFRELFCHA